MEERDKYFGMNMYTLLLFKIGNQYVPTYSTENSAQCYMAAWMGGHLGGEHIHVYVWLSLFLVHLKLSQYC